MLRTIPRVAIGASLTLIRLPIDGAVRLAGRGDSLGLAVDRADATVRGLVGYALADEALIDDASRRHEAADERERALRLRSRASSYADTAQQSVEEGVRKADRTRAQAAEDTDRKQREARKRSRSRKDQAATASRKRRAAAATSAARREEQIEKEAKQARLGQLETRAEALKEKEEALAARDEARLLREAASRAKADRKARPG